MNGSVHTLRTDEASPAARAIDLPTGQTLWVESDGAETTLRVDSAKATLVTLRIREDGAEVLLPEGCALRSRGDLTLDGENVRVRARDALRFEAGGDVQFRVAGDLYSEARIQTIRATLGNVNLKANDDVKLRAERILLNT